PDFPDLFEMVKRVDPKKFFTLHGFAADFAQTLRSLGYEAQALSETEQMSLALVMEERSKKRIQARGAGPKQVGAAGLAAGSADTFLKFAQTCSKICDTPRKLEKTRLLAEYL